MTREEAKELLPIIKAFSEGKEIQIKPKEGKFWSSSYTNINFSDLSMKTTEYRIKPEPEYRPFKNAEECWNEMQKHQPVGWVQRKIRSFIDTISQFDKSKHCSIYIIDKWYSLNEVFQCYTFADGTPFGKLREEE